jgi:SAM-dependent methyltransferase
MHQGGRVHRKEESGTRKTFTFWQVLRSLGAPLSARRDKILSSCIAPLLPRGASLLDIGCADGHLCSQIRTIRPDVTALGAEILLYRSRQIPVLLFDGERLPCPYRTFDAVLLVDVIHHLLDPVRFLREAARVTRGQILIKDHLAATRVDRFFLAVNDWTGNIPSRVPLPFRYWSREQWNAVLASAGLSATSWNEELPMYRGWAPWLRGRTLHFLAEFEVAGTS